MPWWWTPHTPPFPGRGQREGVLGWGGVTIINGSPAMLMVRRTIGFILCHMLPTAAQTDPVSTGALLFGWAHNHHGTRANQGSRLRACVWLQARASHEHILRRVFNRPRRRTCRLGNWHPIDAVQRFILISWGTSKQPGAGRCSPGLLVGLGEQPSYHFWCRCIMLMMGSKRTGLLFRGRLVRTIEL